MKSRHLQGAHRRRRGDQPGRGHRVGRDRSRSSAPAASNGTSARRRPYSGYERFDFDIPTAKSGDSYDRAAVRVEEMRQSLRIIEQCVESCRTESTRPTIRWPCRRSRSARCATSRRSSTHFLDRELGANIPPGEACATVEGAKGQNRYYLDQRRRQHVLQDADTDAVLRAHPDGAHDVEGAHRVRPRRDPGQRRLRPRGRGQVRGRC